MAEDAIESRLIVPAFVEVFKDMYELRLTKAVEVRHNGIQLADHILLLIRRKGAALYSNGFSPLVIAMVRTRETAREMNYTLP